MLVLGIWTQLKKIKITLSYSDYFEDINDPKMRKEYKKIIERLQASLPLQTISHHLVIASHHFMFKSSLLSIHTIPNSYPLCALYRILREIPPSPACWRYFQTIPKMFNN